MTAGILADAAFGPDPGRWPLPDAVSPTELWLRAVAAGGQGRYASARADLAALLRRCPPGGLGSLALSTRASFLRQLGWHPVARGVDGRAFAHAGDDPEAAVDALAGLAADALGVGRLAASAALLTRAEQIHRRADAPPPRLGIRLAWVNAELSMAAGDGHAAVRHAVRGVERAERAAPALSRHRVKSDVVLAAAPCCSGDLSAARAVADTALAATMVHGLVPLRWALACLLVEVDSDAHSNSEVADIRAAAAEFITRHGGRLSSG